MTAKRITSRRTATPEPTPTKRVTRKVVGLITDGKLTTTANTTIAAVARVASTVRKFYAFIEGARPNEDRARLYAHTEAVLQFLGLYTMSAKTEVVKVLIGQRAMLYHNNIGNFERTGDSTYMTDRGQKQFNLRLEKKLVPMPLVAGFLKAIRSGTANPALGINADHLVEHRLPIR